MRARGTVLAVALVVAVGAACGDDSESAAPSTSRARSTTTTTTTAPLVATETDLRDCDRTIEPFFRRGPGDGFAPVEVLEGENLLFSGTREARPLRRTRRRTGATSAATASKTRSSTTMPASS